MNYSEQTFLSKSGNECLLLNLRDYYESLEEHQKSKPSNSHVICECPICIEEDYTKHKLYIKDDFSVGHCFHCHVAFIDNSNDGDYNVYDNPSRFEIPQLEDLSQFKLVKLEGNKWNLDLYESLGNVNTQGIQYLESRGNPFLSKLFRPIGIRFYGKNPIIPFYFHGELIYYQIKLVEGDIKYFSPPISKKPIYVIEKSDNVGRKFVIVEGIFDAIACLILFPDRVPVALLGSSITTYQIWMLNSYTPYDILIYLDKTELSQKIYYRLSAYIDYATIKVHPSDGTDPEEYLINKINKVSN